MPQNKNNKPSEGLTWSKASPAIIIATIVDLVRIFFEFFWFFGPALAGTYCVAKVGDVAVVGKLLAAGCVATAGTVGFFSVPALAAFGAVMAMAVGFGGWLIVGGWLAATNARIFKENALWFVGSLAVSEVPFVGALPAITVAVWRMYHVQIKKERDDLKKWEVAHAAQIQKEQRQAAQIEQQEAANDATYVQAEAVGEQEPSESSNNVIPLPERKPQKPLASVPRYTEKAA